MVCNITKECEIIVYFNICAKNQDLDYYQPLVFFGVES
jgi:hypothetical protein